MNTSKLDNLSKEEIEKYMKHDPRHISINALNQFSHHNSSARQIMFANHLAQALVLNNGDEEILQSGIERELAKTSFGKRLEDDSRIIAIIPRYKNKLSGKVSSEVEVNVIYENLNTRRIESLNVPYNSKMHTYFGFKYKRSSVMNTMSVGDILPAGTVLADSPAVVENNGYKWGKNINTLIASTNETAEDAITISEEIANSLDFNIYEERTIEVGEGSDLLNLYGTVDEPKFFPHIGERIHESGLIAAKRKSNYDMVPALNSVHDIMEVNHTFDDCVYARDNTGVVVDIIVEKHVKKKEPKLYAAQQLKQYVDANLEYHRDIVNVYRKLEEHNRRLGITEAPNISNDFHRQLVDSMAIIESSEPNSGFKKTWRNEPTDIYRITFIIEYKLKSGVQYKFTGKSGDKSIVTNVVPRADMPRDKNGVVADLLVDVMTTPSRMNIARVYTSYISGSAREAQRQIRLEVEARYPNVPHGYAVGTMSVAELNMLWGIVIEYISTFDGPQFKAYHTLGDDGKRVILKEIVEKEFFVGYMFGQFDSVEIVNKIRNSRFKPLKDNIYIKNHRGEWVMSKEKMIIAPMYYFMLAKIADTWLATSSARLSHFNTPTGLSGKNKHSTPFRDKPVKNISETEGRLLASLAPTEVAAELKNRAISVTTHEAIYRNVLNADSVSNIEHIVDRSVIGYDEDKSLELVNSLFMCSGIGIAYSPEDKPEDDGVKQQRLLNDDEIAVLENMLFGTPLPEDKLSISELNHAMGVVEDDDSDVVTYHS